MQTRTANFWVDAESVWGIERLDPLEQLDWSQSLWQRLQAPGSPPRPWFMPYTPAAERAALRGLTALARLGRDAGFVVHIFAPMSLPVLPAISTNTPALCVVHRGNRWLNLEEWLKLTSAKPACRIVITMPAAAEDGLAIMKKFNGIPAPAPEEERDYCARQAQDILGRRFWSAAPEPGLAVIEKILVEAGVAEIAVPLTLLARCAGLEVEALAPKLRTHRWREFIWWPDLESPRLVAFRGRWLAEIIAPTARAEHYPHLTALLKVSDPCVASERYYFLNLLAALRAEGAGRQAEALLGDYYDRFHTAGQSAEPDECEVWAYFHPPRLHSHFRV